MSILGIAGQNNLPVFYDASSKKQEVPFENTMDELPINDDKGGKSKDSTDLKLSGLPFEPILQGTLLPTAPEISKPLAKSQEKSSSDELVLSGLPYFPDSKTAGLPYQPTKVASQAKEATEPKEQTTASQKEEAKPSTWYGDKVLSVAEEQEGPTNEHLASLWQKILAMDSQEKSQLTKIMAMPQVAAFMGQELE